MSTHEAPDTVLTRLEADRLRARALELVAELDTLAHDGSADEFAVWRWAGSASIILKELARG